MYIIEQIFLKKSKLIYTFAYSVISVPKPLVASPTSLTDKIDSSVLNLGYEILVIVDSIADANISKLYIEKPSLVISSYFKASLALFKSSLFMYKKKQASF